MFSHVCTRPPLVGREGSAACWANTTAFFHISRSCYVSQGQRTRELASVDTWQRKHDPSCPAASWCQRQRFVNPNYQDTLLVTFSGPARPSLHNTRRSGLSSNFWIPPLETRVRSSCGKKRNRSELQQPGLNPTVREGICTVTWYQPSKGERSLKWKGFLNLPQVGGRDWVAMMACVTHQHLRYFIFVRWLSS